MGVSLVKQEFEKIVRHPCFSRAAHRWFACIHLPVALRCNIKCGYCSPGYACPNYNPPEIAGRVVNPSQAVANLKKAVRNNPRISVVGISGPGESLANKETFETLRLINKEHPDLIKCVSTNGLLLADKVDELVELGVDSLHVTVNAVDLEAARFIYGWIRCDGEEYIGNQGAAILMERQFEGIRAAVKRGIVVKVNSVLIPGINEDRMSEIALAVKVLGAHSMSIIPLNPADRFEGFNAPEKIELERIKKFSSTIIRQTENYSR